ncbi:MAG: group II truncated hemoglobin [Pseudomonadota bacterium]
MKQSIFGFGSATYDAAGGEEGIRQLVDRFYQLMASRDAYRVIWSWHPNDNAVSRDKLARFLCGWMGGPRRYQEKYGSINIPAVHAHLAVDEKARNAWLDCMSEALDTMPYSDELKRYLLVQLAKPAERIRAECESRDLCTGD